MGGETARNTDYDNELKVDVEKEVVRIMKGATTANAGKTLKVGDDGNPEWSVTTVTDTEVTGSLLTGLSAVSSYAAPAATDTLLVALNKLTYDVSNAEIISKTLTSYSRGAALSSVASTNTIKEAIQILDGNRDFGYYGYETTATAAGTTGLAAASKELQYFTGTLGQTVTMPVASTLAVGRRFHIVNNSTGVLTVNSSGGNLIQSMPGGTAAFFTCILASGTDATSWDVVGSDTDVLATKIAGFISGAGTVAASDTILQAINKLDGNSANAAVISQLLTAYSQPTSYGAITATNTILSGIQQAAANAVEQAVRKVPVRDLSLNAALTLAEDVKTKLVGHLASAGSGTGAHASADATSGAGIGPTAPTNLATLLARAGELLTAYDTHEADAELGAAWVWHLAQETGDHSLTSAVTPTTLAEAVTRLTDLRAKLNAHDADDSAHDVASGFQVTATAYAATLTSSDQVVGPSVLEATFTVTLPTSICVAGRLITVKDFAGNATAQDLVVVTEGSELIDGAADITINTDDDKRTLVSDGTNWFTI